ncbi:MAG: hypothetical protein OHK0029_24200 [Armatimonadaceae bacterium]
MVTEYAALVEPADDKYRAIASAPFNVVAFGKTEKEALEQLDEEVRKRLQQGAKVVRRRIEETQAHPLARFAGTSQTTHLPKTGSRR